MLVSLKYIRRRSKVVAKVFPPTPIIQGLQQSPGSESLSKLHEIVVSSPARKLQENPQTVK
jgi:hypothetical protein